MNSKIAFEKFKKSPELLEYLNSYGMVFFNMACKDIRKYLEAKHPKLGRSFVENVHNAFLDGEDLDLTLVRPQPTNAIPSPSVPFSDEPKNKSVVEDPKPTDN